MTELYPLLTIGGTVLIVALILAMVAVTWWFDVRHARLPQATRLEDLTQRNTSLMGQIGEKQAELADIQRRILDRDRVAAEVAALTQHVADLKAEMAAMAGATETIEALKRDAADAVLRKAEVEQQLDATLAAKEAADAALKAAKEELGTLPRDQENLLRSVERLQGEQHQLENSVAELRNERATLVAAREEAASLTGRSAALVVDWARMTAAHTQQAAMLADLQEQKGSLQADIAVLQQARAEAEAAQEKFATSVRDQDDLLHSVERLQGERHQLENDVAELRNERATLAAAREEAASLAGRRAVLEMDLERMTAAHTQQTATLAQLREQKGSLQADITDLQQAREEAGALSAELRRMHDECDALLARKAALEVAIKLLEDEAKPGGPEGVGDDGDLRKLPTCLAIQGTSAKPVQRESAAIEEVRQSLIRHGLKYSGRTIDAFHTSLKINEVAQLTVLAGVSGTGKSLLPRRYAEAMGMSFLPIAVEPRWDSPQDLLGFYNYVEKRYRATDLARALVHMDPQNTSGLSHQPLGDRMLLVLLDEMNLARVEYYFSEFLSRLELRPRWSAAIAEDARRQASMPLDTRERSGGSVHLFPSHNVLFVGTMNDDESTQALSDKVLDRGNVMQFPAPATFERAQPQQVEEVRSDVHLDFGDWRGWIRDPVVKDPAEAQKVQGVINRLADIMRRCGRPFGHRLNEAVMAYVANYPKSAVDKLRLEEALADQIELRILPKLRGVVLDDGENRQALEDVVALLRNDLHDSSFANHLQTMLEGDISQFNWRGLDR